MTNKDDHFEENYIKIGWKILKSKYYVFSLDFYLVKFSF